MTWRFIQALNNFWQQKQLKAWLKDANIHPKKTQYEALIKGHNGFWLSKQARLSQDDLSLTYGEIDFISFALILKRLNIKEQDIFLDMGSGIGTCTLATCLLSPCHRIIGVELLAPLYEASLAIRDGLEEPDKKRLIYHCKDFLAYDLREATHIYIAATAFFGALWQNILNHLLTTTKGAQLIVLSRNLPEDVFYLHYQSEIKTSWGSASLSIYEKK